MGFQFHLFLIIETYFNDVVASATTQAALA
jgi:hypothetical protein